MDSAPCQEGGTKVAARWITEGHHLGYRLLQDLGSTTVRSPTSGTFCDELSLLTQIKLAQMADAGGA